MRAQDAAAGARLSRSSSGGETIPRAASVCQAEEPEPARSRAEHWAACHQIADMTLRASARLTCRRHRAADVDAMRSPQWAIVGGRRREQCDGADALADSHRAEPAPRRAARPTDRWSKCATCALISRSAAASSRAPSARQSRGRRQLRRPAGQDARPGRRIRLRQNHRRPDDPPPDPRHRRRASATRAKTSSPIAAKSFAGCAGTCRSSSRTRSAA